MQFMPTHLNIYRMCLFSVYKQMFIIARRLDAYVGSVYKTHDPRDPTNPVEGGSRLHSLFAETVMYSTSWFKYNIYISKCPLSNRQ